MLIDDYYSVLFVCSSFFAEVERRQSRERVLKLDTANDS